MQTAATPLLIGPRRELFWDEFLLDESGTDAILKLHHPVAEEIVLTHDAPWEGDGCDFHCILKDGPLYRMYYLAWQMLSPKGDTHTTGQIVVAYAESSDGLHWQKPDLGICEFQGSRKNNILLDGRSNRFDNFFVFKDSRPGCPAEELYKGITLYSADRSLHCFISPDGLHFRDGWRITGEGHFDTLNTAFWSDELQRYLCYIRDFHPPLDETPPAGQAPSGPGIRDIRWLESTDFRTWSSPRRLEFGVVPDYPLYTNVIQPYCRARHLFIGFPSRYIERRQWTPNFDQLPGRERREQRSRIHPRYGLALTDCLFMSSRDGKQWKRWDEAFLRPGPERPYNWVYGDCFPAHGLIETPSRLPGAADELSLYTFENHWGGIPAGLRRHSIRKDGFVSCHADGATRRLLTRPFLFEGDRLSLNFSSSAAGFVRLRLLNGTRTLSSCEMFGDTLDRQVPFSNGTPGQLSGQPVRMEIEFCDADLFSFCFE